MNPINQKEIEINGMYNNFEAVSSCILEAIANGEEVSQRELEILDVALSILSDRGSDANIDGDK